ncbi:unnamed protein product [Rotaria socialis]|uniref:Uncharacterized protein n=1 Tax=Rotaria socialis TaxID=392032 RepID=A0A821CT72_9BILA|nr:unnamed protein product [Rotaria socialis]CAF4497562.1 unnamed protein product [Rotaria socialis]CAF4610019.1 unnamed protein product [Rotaria socialis]CAF4794038.1 unnamed protein product [Rotaria socialis]
MRDLHSDLLEEIKNRYINIFFSCFHRNFSCCLGIQLNHRKKEEDKKAAVSTKPSTPNVMAIMEQAAKYDRDKIHPKSESENNDESSQWDDMTIDETINLLVYQNTNVGLYYYL